MFSRPRIALAATLLAASLIVPTATFAQSVPPPSTTSTRQGISPPLLARLVRACTPAVYSTMQSSANAAESGGNAWALQSSVIAAESSGNAWALHDNNDDRSYYPQSYDEAVATAERVIADDRWRYGARDAGLDIGIGQINSNNFPGLRVNAATMLHPCLNLRQSSSMLARGFSQEYARFRGVAEPQRVEMATRGALQIYNSGKDHGDNAYVERVLLASHSALARGMLAPSEAVAPPTATYAAYGLNAPYVQPYVQPQVSPSPVSDTLFAHDDPFRRESRAQAKIAALQRRPNASRVPPAPTAAVVPPDTIFAHEDPFARDRDPASSLPETPASSSP